MTLHARIPMLACLLLAPASCQDPASAEGSSGESGGASSDTPPDLPPLPTYIQPTQECRPPVEGEAQGTSENGDICTWQAIAGATEEGRRFRDYASCDVVRTQRPYYPVPPAPGYAEPDPRMEDPEYADDVEWIRAQIDATGCSCCHSSDPSAGPVRWSVDMPGNWVNAMDGRDLAALADWIDTSMFGRFPPEQNNGFIRDSGLPSTDPARALAFFEDELAARGLRREDFVDEPPTGGPLVEQRAYVPAACQDGEGVMPDGTLVWTGGPARYVYVLQPDSENPTVPPNLDLPIGTLWRIDVPHVGDPMQAGRVRYGEVPTGASQRHPVEGSPAALQPGSDYYLYVTRDVFQPITRCLFTFGG